MEVCRRRDDLRTCGMAEVGTLGVCPDRAVLTLEGFNFPDVAREAVEFRDELAERVQLEVGEAVGEGGVGADFVEVLGAVAKVEVTLFVAAPKPDDAGRLAHGRELLLLRAPWEGLVGDEVELSRVKALPDGEADLGGVVPPAPSARSARDRVNIGIGHAKAQRVAAYNVVLFDFTQLFALSLQSEGHV